MKVVMLFLVVGGFYVTYLGVSLHMDVGPAEAAHHQHIEEYYSQAKSIRDGATTGSDLNKQLVEIQKAPSQLLTLKLLGVGKILTGIFMILLAILMALVMMPVRLGAFLKK